MQREDINEFKHRSAKIRGGTYKDHHGCCEGDALERDKGWVWKTSTKALCLQKPEHSIWNPFIPQMFAEFLRGAQALPKALEACGGPDPAQPLSKVSEWK